MEMGERRKHAETGRDAILEKADTGIMNETPGRITLAKCREICARHGKMFEKIRDCRHALKSDIPALQEMIIYLREEKKWSYPAIGRFLKRDNSTIRWHVREILE